MHRLTPEYIDQHVEQQLPELVQLIKDVCEIPSPTGSEKQKAQFVMDRLKEYGAQNVIYDEVGNVLFLYESHEKQKNEACTLFTAHIDTVFPNLQNIQAEIKNNRLYAPSAGDNSANVAGLLFTVKMILTQNITFSKPLLFGFNVGEEGLGNLLGIRHIMKEWEGRIDEVISVDGTYRRVKNTGVASKRYEVHIQTTGGHSWGSFGRTSAIAVAAAITDQLYQLQVPSQPKTTYNVGTIQGGTTINAIAQDTTMRVDLRSVDRDELEKLAETFLEICGNRNKDDVKVKVQLLAERPGGKVLNNPLEPLIINTREKLGLETKFVASSTDSNIPLSQGIPALTFGIYFGRGAHTLEEYIELDSLQLGIRHLLYFLMNY